MKRLLWITGLLGLALLASLGTMPAIAEGEITLTPTQLTVAGTRGAQVMRTVVLQASTPITGLAVVMMDLAGTDGVSVLPAGAIEATLPADALDPNEPLALPLTFDLSEVPSGQFTGELLFPYHDGSFNLPMTVTVKDPPVPPLLMLIGGVALGMGVSWYRAQGRPRDEVLVRVGQLRTQVKADKALQQQALPFYERIDAELVDVEIALQAKKWPEAQQAVDEAETLWLRWRKGRADWLRQLTYYETLLKQLKAAGEALLHIKGLLQSAENAFHALPDLEGPGAFRTSLAAVATKFNTFNDLLTLIQELSQLGEPWQTRAQRFQKRLEALDPGDEATYPGAVTTLKQEIEAALDQALQETLASSMTAFQERVAALENTEAAAWQEKALAFQQRVNALQAGDREGYRALLQDVDAAIDDVAALQPVTRGEEISYGIPKGVPGGLIQALAAFLLPPAVAEEGAIRAQSWEEKTTQAGKRLRWFTGLSYVVAVLLLAGAGFGELYLAQATFGASPWGDYFALLAWGFGAEATRASITDLVKQWGMGEQET